MSEAGSQRQARGARGLFALGEVLVTLGAVVALFIGYQLWGTGVYTHAAQHRLERDLGPTVLPAAPTPAAPTPDDHVAREGGAQWRLFIPRFGQGWERAVVEGVSHEDLKQGPGHYPGTALPGMLGNTVISGHRTTYGAPFNQAGELRPGDWIGLETRTRWELYQVSGLEVVLPTQSSVIYPVPGRAGAQPTVSQLTLTTCTPMYSASHRLVVHAQWKGFAPLGSVPSQLR